MSRISAKRIEIDKANTTVMIVVAVASFIVVFSLVASKSLLSQRSYQAKVISDRKKTEDTLKSNIEQAKLLNTAYEDFASKDPNIIGGRLDGVDSKDGDNPRLILDALPSKYDFPGLLSSIEKMLTDEKFVLSEVKGDDDEINQSQNQSSETPQPIEMPFSVTVVSNASAEDVLLGLFEKSIRPMQVTSVKYASDNEKDKLTVEAKSYYQPEKKFNVREEARK